MEEKFSFFWDFVTYLRRGWGKDKKNINVICRIKN